ncbi:neuronal acetylcholine receptor subunit alpha-2 isoform X1 [Drosophila pseudoobscura]|uniref:Neuronal acetylcholine receptor subunit alpha-2 isoform X1 n=1 Tax=Drosophila pseudoobscura pseudoobscura TaxID=46245 RepID=A0A6I8V831_DROPS|nr:neuronal acetylcholine receptor subunit alpha-2 isoform X1 [Drosophila pseudoobscura]
MTTSPKIKTLISGRGMLRLLGIFVLFAVSVPGATLADAAPKTASSEGNGNVNALDRLHAGLFINYDKHSQPLDNGDPSAVNMSLTINFIDIDEMNGKMTTHCWLSIRWTDERRTWQPQEYENITAIHLRASEIWKPQITLFNGAGDEDSFLVDTQAILTHDGQFLWVPPAVYTAYCNLNMINWPHDEQTCKLKIGSWGVRHINADYNKMEKGLDYDGLMQSTEWQIISGDTKFVPQDYYSYLEYTLTAQRRSNMYTAIIYTPAACFVILALSAFWLPPHMGGEKIMINGLLMIVVSSFLMYFAQLLPVLANKTPLVVVFYSYTLLLLGISTIVEVGVLYLATAKHKRRVPDCLKKLLHGKFGSWLFLSHFSSEAEQQTDKNKEMDEHVYDNADGDPSEPLDINPSEVPSSRAIQFEWALLATAVDRVTFVAFSLTFLILAIVCHV